MNTVRTKEAVLTRFKLIRSRDNEGHASNLLLMESAEAGHLDLVKMALTEGANIHYIEDYALRYASLGGHYNIVNFLLLNGADLTTKKYAPFWLATATGKYDVCALLVEFGSKWKDITGRIDLNKIETKEEALKYLKLLSI